MRHAVCFVATNETANGKSKKYACFKCKVRVIATCQYCKTVLRLRTIQFSMLLATPGLKEDENACICFPNTITCCISVKTYMKHSSNVFLNINLEMFPVTMPDCKLIV